MTLERKMLLNISNLKGISTMRLANENDIPQANLSRWFKSQKGGYVKEEKIERMAKYLGLDYKVGKLFPGVHRWTVPSHLIEDVLQVESIVQKFLPGGGTIYPVRRKNPILIKMTTESYVPWSPWVRWVLVPLAFPDLRVILKMGEKVKQLISPFDNHSPDPFRMEGWFCPEGSKGNKKEEIKKTLWVDLPEEMFLRLSGDEDLSVHDLDIILGITGSLGWTWEKLIPVLEAKGTTPDEIARNHGLL
ncbi:hypothetical protein [Leptospirillum ferrooxidans]|uniref:Uncharacterized protein n=1 Tax=Leptospirillum ferrooxidans (strain C2-3) TaxID=1162668 RepID=I0ILX1_LEPFC|nr:hypothetical protein [Leptospirillum ferrooxidans]BAM06270.1 hypothetical protein LFE_0554 [Leptospirillum ferrooxidans C2-3]